jgi:hypothetical protein
MTVRVSLARSILPSGRQQGVGCWKRARDMAVAFPCRKGGQPFLVGVFLALATQPVVATISIEEVIVTAARDGHRVQAPALQIDRAGIEDRAPRAVSDLFRSTEIAYVGPAYDLNEDGSLARLPSSTSLNLRAFLELDGPYEGGALTLFAALDNANDELVLPQLGLPAPGRTWRLGIRVGAKAN